MMQPTNFMTSNHRRMFSSSADRNRLHDTMHSIRDTRYSVTLNRAIRTHRKPPAEARTWYHVVRMCMSDTCLYVDRRRKQTARGLVSDNGAAWRIVANFGSRLEANIWSCAIGGVTF